MKLAFALRGFAKARERPRPLFAAAASVLTIALIGVGYARCHCLFHEYDDAYITFRYAHNLASGKGLVFNPGEPTDSASSFLYTIVLALLDVVGMHDLPFWAAMLGVACTGALAAVVYAGCERWTQRPLLALFVAVAVATNGLLAAWTVSGMETALFTWLVTFASYRLFVVRALGIKETVLVAACLLTRYEALLLAAVWLGLVLFRAFRAAPPERRSLGLQLAAVALGFAIFLAFKRISYGTLIPHALALKRTATLYAPNPEELWSHWRTSASAFLLFGAVGVFLLPRTIESLAFIVYLGLSCASFVLGPASDGSRYTVHVLPAVALFASLPLAILLRELWPLALAAAIATGWQSYRSFEDARVGIKLGSGHAACREKIGRALERKLAPGTPVLSSDIGGIAYYAPSIVFIDAVGLTSSDVLEAREHGRSVDPILYAKRPHVIADTCQKGCLAPDSFSAYAWLTRAGYWTENVPALEYAAQLRRGRPLELCRSPDGIWFGATEFQFMPERHPRHRAGAR